MKTWHMASKRMTGNMIRREKTVKNRSTVVPHDATSVGSTVPPCAEK